MIPKPAGRQHLFLALQERIEHGHYPPGSWLPAERALALEFGVDRSAIRAALTQLENAQLIVRELGRRPWVHSRGQSRRTSAAPPGDLSGQTARQQTTQLRTIAAILPQHPQFPASLAIMHGINAALRSAEAPFRLQVIDTHGGSEQRETCLEMNALDSVIAEDIAGVVLWHMGGTETLPQLRQLEACGIPVVFVDRFPPEIACDFVGSDNFAGIEAAVDYLRSLGHRRIAHLTTDEPATAVAERLAAYRDSLQAGGLTPDPDWICTLPHDHSANAAPACDRFFRLPEPPTAVLAMNDALAYHFIAECDKRGIRTPEDISVIGFDDLENHSPRPPVLTTLHQPFDKMGRRAADLLLRRLAEPSAEGAPRRHVLLPAPLIERTTCRPI